MEINWNVLGIFGAGIIVLVIYIIMQNRKDRKKLEKSMNKDYKSSNEDESELNDE